MVYLRGAGGVVLVLKQSGLRDSQAGFLRTPGFRCGGTRRCCGHGGGGWGSGVYSGCRLHASIRLCGGTNL